MVREIPGKGIFEFTGRDRALLLTSARRMKQSPEVAINRIMARAFRKRGEKWPAKGKGLKQIKGRAT